MRANKYYALTLGLALISLAAAFPPNLALADGEDTQFVVASSMLSGLAPGAVFPFIDTTPRPISRAHIAVTDATTECSTGAAPPAHIVVLVGEAGVNLVPVMDASTNTGISHTPGQCVFHVTINAGRNGVPATVTDIVIVNAGEAPLSGINTVTASAKVRVER